MAADDAGADMRFAKPIASIAAMIAAGGATAQSTSNCMNMGGGMVHCDNMGSNGSTSSTNCTAMGGGMSNCTTMPMGQPQTAPPTPDMSRPQTNGSTMSFIGDLIAQSRERSFQKKLGQMLSSGDCQGAANFAFAKGRYDVSSTIRRTCVTKLTPGAGTGMIAEQPMSGQPTSPVGQTQQQSAEALSLAFDLMCNGSETQVSKAGLKEVPYARTLRIDLDSGRYCDGECVTTRLIAKVEPTRITLYDSFGPTGKGGDQWLDRERGMLFSGSIGVDRTTMAEAQCERRPFSGFPQPKF